MAKKKTKTLYRDSVTGEFITKDEAKRRPRETEKEEVRIPHKKKKEKKCMSSKNPDRWY